jgi:hypothetical protein
MLGGASVGVNAGSITVAPRHRKRRPTFTVLQSSAPSGPVDDIHNSALRRRSGVFPYTRSLMQLPVAIDFPVLLPSSLPADMTTTL